VFAGSDDAGAALAFAGDGDGDGVEEILVAAPAHDNDDGEVYLIGLTLPDFGDCNANGVSDLCDISSGTSQDNDGNGIPDECEGATAIDDTGLPARTRLIGAFPSPFNPRTELAFELGAPSPVSLMIYDVSGKLIKSLIRGERFAPGRHSVAWQGRDDSGRQVAAGVYFYRFEAGGHSDVGRMALVK